MGRYATIKSEYKKEEDTELACSGILAQAIHKTVGDERFEEWGITLTYHEVITVMMEMTKIMEDAVSLDYQKIVARATGYRKLSVLMLWCRNADDTYKLTFC